jgi:hypothetical protein
LQYAAGSEVRDAIQPTADQARPCQFQIYTTSSRILF